MVRISVHLNGDINAVLASFEGDLAALLAAGSKTLNIQATRAFLKNGSEIRDASLVGNDEEVFFSTGGPFIAPASMTPMEANVVSTLDAVVRRNIMFYLNGKRIVLDQADPEMNLLEYLRSVDMTSVKKPCGEGGCGGCAVALARYDPVEQRVRYFAVNSCLVPLPFIDGMAVITAEGVGYGDNLHRIQRDLAQAHGTQCGFCSPGIITTLYALFADNPERTVAEIDEALSTNLCRCTGYRPIFDAVRRYAIDFKKENLGRVMLEGPNKDDIEDLSCKSTRANPLVTADFPEELRQLVPQPVVVSGPNTVWYKPATLSQFSAIRAKKGRTATIVSGATDLNFKKCYRPNLTWDLLVSTIDIPELRQVKPVQGGVEFGAATNINALNDYWHKAPAEYALLAHSFLDVCKHFANYNIRNIGTIGGSLVAGDSLSDLCPILIGTNSEAIILGQNGQRRLPCATVISDPTVLTDDEFILSIFVPFTKPEQLIRSFKIAKRREDSQAVTNGCFNVTIVDKKVTAASLAIGAVARKPYKCTNAETAIIGKEWTYDTFQLLMNGILDHIEVSERVGQKELRKNLIRAICYKFFIWAAKKINVTIDKRFNMTDLPFERKERKSQQSWTQRKEDVVGKQIPHVSAFPHTSGEARFVGDLPVPENCVFAAPVMSKKAHAKIESIDASEALALEGVVAFFSAKDIKGAKKISSIPPADEDVFADEWVTIYGQIVGIVCADSEHLARKAATKVKVNYGEEKPVIVTIKQAMENAKGRPKDDKEIYITPHMGISRGKPAETHGHIEITGESYINNQEHFYLETNSILCMPLGAEGMRIYAACQNPSKIQESVAQVLQIPRNQVICEVMRLGGGFGGKQDRPQFYACQAAVASHILDRPVRYVLSRQEDIQTSGMRHEYFTEYRIGCDQDHKLTVFEATYHSNAGSTTDLSNLVMDRTVYSATGGYACPNVGAWGTIYRTNKLSCTAFRGFGVPQSLLTIETAMAKLGHHLKVRPEVLKEANLYHPTDKTVTGYELPDDSIRLCWEACKRSCDWDNMVRECEAFNAANVYKKRGVAMVPVVSTMGFESEFMMKGACLVQIFGDGSVTVSHGGIEMGQGIHTKMQQICAQTLGISADLVKVVPTTTEKTVNMPPTAGSTGTDLHGGAVFRAAEQLKANLKPIRDEHPDWSWQQICGYAFFNKFDMQASGFNPLPKSVYDHHTGEGREAYYLIWSVGASLVELDVLTGEYLLLRTDLVHDCGSSINPGLDIGQIEGGFVQGEGLFTLEEHIWDEVDGHLRTRNVTTYKIPTLDDIPDVFNVTLLNDDYNEMGVYGSKASGEAGLRLGCAVLMALRDAVGAARHEFGNDEWFELHSPATQEQLRSLIDVEFRNPTK